MGEIFSAVYSLPGEHRKLPQQVMAEPIKLLLSNLFEKKSQLSGSILEGFLIMNKDINHGLNKDLCLWCMLISMHNSEKIFSCIYAVSK